MKRRDLFGIGAVAAGSVLAGCSRSSADPKPASSTATIPVETMPTEDAGIIIDRVIYTSLKEAVSITDVVLLGTMGHLKSFSLPYPNDPKHKGLPPDLRSDAVVTVKQVILDRRTQPTPFSECRLSFYGGEANGKRYVAASDPLPTAGEDYLLLLLLAESPDLPHSSARRSGVPDMVTVMFGDGRWRVGSDRLLRPEVGFEPIPWAVKAFSGKSLDQAAAVVRAAG